MAERKSYVGRFVLSILPLNFVSFELLSKILSHFWNSMRCVLSHQNFIHSYKKTLKATPKMSTIGLQNLVTMEETTRKLSPR